MRVLEVNNVTKIFKSNRNVVALNNINLKIDEKEFFGLLGPNGAGKTTLLNIILTIIIPDKGEVKIFGKNPFLDAEALRKLNYVPVEKPYSHLKVKDFLYCYAKLYGVEIKRIKYVMRKFKLSSLKEKECWTLSTGELSRVALAKSLLNKPKLLILDEPTFGLDPKNKIEVQKTLKKINKNGTTIFFATHDMVEAERLATKVAFIKSGKILDVREKKEIVKKFGSLEEYWIRLGK
ncbi:MAG: ABC transporter ATP-binding protein [Candidatus Aenigmatarchaeota archaeon]